MGIRVGDSGYTGVLESLSRGREGKGRWGFVCAGWRLLGKGGGRVRIWVEESGSSWEPGNLSRGREGKGRWG